MSLEDSVKLGAMATGLETCGQRSDSEALEDENSYGFGERVESASACPDTFSSPKVLGQLI